MNEFDTESLRLYGKPFDTLNDDEREDVCMSLWYKDKPITGC